MALETINPRTVAEKKETIGTLVFMSTVEIKDGELKRMYNGSVTEDNIHLANFGLDENGYFNLNFPMYTQEKMVAVCAALPAFINNVKTAE